VLSIATLAWAVVSVSVWQLRKRRIGGSRGRRVGYSCLKLIIAMILASKMAD
jgi:hypothetical protein